MIRDILSSDRENFLEMQKGFYSSDAVAENVDFKNFEKTFDLALNKSPLVRILMIEDDGNPIGYGILAFMHSNEFGGTLVLIEELYIDGLHRSKGYGSKFFDFLEKEYIQAKQLRLEVRKDNERAIKLYHSMGYRILEYVQMVKDI